MFGEIEFVFVYSYCSNSSNWERVKLGDDAALGRVGRGIEIGKELGISVVANDSLDRRNWALFKKMGIENINTALNTKDEVISALALSVRGRVLFVTSPDHLPRVARNALAAGGSDSVFVASEVPLSEDGAEGVQVLEPAHNKGDVYQCNAMQCNAVMKQ